MRVRCVQTGRVRLKRGERGVRRYVADDWREETRPVNAFLADHPAGACLFDTGQAAAAARPGHFPRWQPFFRLVRFELAPDDEAGAQLRRLGVAPETVRWVVLSHLHTDHVGGLAAFAGADVLASRVELDRARGVLGQVRGYLPGRWPPGLRARALDLDGPAVGPFASSHDVAGDGRLLVVPTPGHTPGHVSLLVDGGDRRWLCGGDLAQSPADLEEVAPAIARWCREEGVSFLAAHDPDAGRLAAADAPPVAEPA